MDTLLKATDIPSLGKGRRCHNEGVSRGAHSFRPDALSDSDRGRRMIGLGPESAIGLVRNTHRQRLISSTVKNTHGIFWLIYKIDGSSADGQDPQIPFQAGPG